MSKTDTFLICFSITLVILFISLIVYKTLKPDEHLAYVQCNSDNILKEGEYIININMPKDNQIEVYLPNNKKIVVQDCSLKIIEDGN